MIYVFLADGFEEIEALAPVDLLRRAGLTVQTVGVTGKVVTGSHGIAVTADILPADLNLNDDLQAVILPGGMPGAKTLDASAEVHAAIDLSAPSAPPRLFWAKKVCFPAKRRPASPALRSS